MKIFILVGGFGRRLKSVVSNVPKPMAPILGKPFLKYQINLIRKYFPNNKIYLLSHYLSQTIEEYFKNDENIIIIKEKEPLGTGGSVKNAIRQLELSKNESIYVLNGDTYIKPNLNKMVENIKSKVSILGSFQEKCDRYGTLTIDNDKILDFNEKNTGVKNAYINAGCYYFTDLFFFDSIEEEKFAIEDKFKEYLLSHSVDIFRYDDVFIDIGIPQDYKKMINYIKELKNENR